MAIYGWKEGKGEHVGSDFLTAKEGIFTSGKYEYFTFQEVFPYPQRIKGEYLFHSTTAILDQCVTKEYWYSIEIKFTDAKEAKKLHDLIRGGKIWPKICYEDNQVPAPCRHIKGLLIEMFGIIRREVAKKLHFA